MPDTTTATQDTIEGERQTLVPIAKHILDDWMENVTQIGGALNVAEAFAADRNDVALSDMLGLVSRSASVIADAIDTTVFQFLKAGR